MSLKFPASRSPREFHLFSKLPGEMRLKIWRAALPDPRVVEVDYSKTMRRWYCPTESSAKVSGLHRACKESRMVFQKFYTPFLRQSHSPTDDEDYKNYYHNVNFYFSSPVIYIDPQVDTLYICGPDIWSAWCKSSKKDIIHQLARMDIVKQLQSLAVESSLLASYTQTRHCMGGQFESLETLLVITEDHHPSRIRNKGRMWGQIKLADTSRIWKYINIYFESIKNDSTRDEDLAIDTKKISRGGVTLLEHK